MFEYKCMHLFSKTKCNPLNRNLCPPYYNRRYKTNKITNFIFLCRNIYHFFIIEVISCSNINACLLFEIFFVFEYKCMHLFSNTKCIFKYKCMHVNARGYGISATKKVILATEELITATLFLILFFSSAAAKVKFDTEEVIRAISTLKVISVTTKRDEN